MSVGLNIWHLNSLLIFINLLLLFRSEFFLGYDKKCKFIFSFKSILWFLGGCLYLFVVHWYALEMYAFLIQLHTFGVTFNYTLAIIVFIFLLIFLDITIVKFVKTKSSCAKNINFNIIMISMILSGIFHGLLQFAFPEKLFVWFLSPRIAQFWMEFNQYIMFQN